MTEKYAIVAFPVFDAADVVESVRRRFDPLASVLPAHITLVFPFVDAATEADLAIHITSAIANQRAFDITFRDVSVEDGGYLFLNVESGGAVLREIHDRLYSSRLESHLSSSHVYEPHITVGRLADPERLTFAANEAKTALAAVLRGRIREVTLFRLDEGGGGEVALTFGLLQDQAHT